MLGDFNAFLKINEKIGHEGISVDPYSDFEFCCMSCGLDDIKSTGCEFTWYNNQGRDSRMCIKLDRVMCNLLWLKYHMYSKALFLESGISNHSLMLVRFVAL